MTLSERAYWVAWAQIPGIGPMLLMRLHRHFASLRLAWHAAPAKLCGVEGIGRQTAQSIAHARSQLNPENLLAVHEQENSHFWTPADVDYPHLLLEIPDPPPILYYRGQVLPGENQGIIPAIAIVGTRTPSDYGQRWTRKISRTLAQAGFSIVSGLAKGIDAIAHRSCLEVYGRTIAVIGTGVNIAYPWANRQLAEAIATHGLIVSEYPIGTKPAAAHFPRRNRIIAGLCRATLVLEAPQKSGALITARVANEYGRDVYALPGSLDNARAEGCLQLMSQGAHTILGETYLLEMLGAIPKLDPTTEQLAFNQSNHSSGCQGTNSHGTHAIVASDDQGSKLGQPSVPLEPVPLEPVPLEPMPIKSALPESVPLEPDAQKVWEAITPNTSVSLDVIVGRCQLPTGAVLALLSQLELMGLVSQTAGMMYQRE